MRETRSMTFEVKVISLFLGRRPPSGRCSQRSRVAEWGLTGTLVTGREKSGWRSYGRRWNRIPDVEVLVGGGVEIVDLELLLITLAATPNARSEALEELDSAEVAGRRRLQLANRLLRLRHHLLRHLSCEVIQLQRNHELSQVIEVVTKEEHTKFLLLGESLSLHFARDAILTIIVARGEGEQRICGAWNGSNTTR